MSEARPLPPPRRNRRRALVLAGGALKGAYGAGVLEELLPALGHTPKASPFRVVEACSSGVFNAAMLAQGKDADFIARAWRRFRPLRVVSPNWRQLWRLWWGSSLLTHKRFMRIVTSTSRRGWGLTFPRPQDVGDRSATFRFNAYDFTAHQLTAFGADLSEAQFRACIALPRWFPPVELEVDGGKHTFVDAVFTTDSNAARLLDEDVKEIWVIWTVDVRGRWSNGWASNYFRMLEQAAAGAYRREREQLTQAGFVPAAQALLEPVVPPRILYEIAADVPCHYLLTFTRRAMRDAVDQGARDTADYLQKYRRLWGDE